MTLFRSLTACVLFFLGLVSASAVVKSARSAYAGFIVTDAATGKVLYEENADVSNPPASMAKLMTFAVLHDQLAAGTLKLDTPVRVMPEDAKMGGTQVFLDPRETFPVEELLYAMMIQSANDAAHALARAAAGSVPAFVELMNAKARELGMTHTTFRTPHGLPPSNRRISDGDLTTPRDFAVLCRHLVLHTDVLKYTSIKEREFGTGVRAQPMRMDNHNKLLGRVAGVDGLKTGYTVGAGYCLSATAERNGRRVIAVIMGSFGPHGEIDKGRTRDLKAIELLERGFAALPAIVAAPAAPAKGPLPDPIKSANVPTVKTDKPAAPAPDQASTTAEPPLTFRVIPPAKKP
ncbi:MAG TPA: D-alanyl-D-alanine carboxypeptidase family protein [Lacunisphaera sp.]|nr:D-alanyl-D-alanine carboxypeptidase family protein [Lacunisphaera sp.]